MRKIRRMAVVGMMVSLPILASACRVPIGNGCDLLIAEPGANIGFVCN